MLRLARKILALSILGWGSMAWSAEPTLESGSVIAAAERLEPGEFLWVPEIAPEGPVLLVVSLTTQRAVIYRNGLPIGITTVSTGRPGHQTPTGMFTILQRRVEHYSSLYNNAPMPYMQRLTWGGVALHGGELPGYPASHGCIRLPHEFARLLYGVSHLGMTVVVTEDSAVPRVAPVEALLGGRRIASSLEAPPIWQPEAAAAGPVSIVVSAADGRVLVLRNGIVIGSAPVTIDGTIDRTTAYMLRAGVGAERSWIRISVPGQETDPGSELRGRIHVEDGFRQNVEAILAPGTTVVVTQDSLRTDGPAQATVLESDERP
ncbi:MAG TPA: L,D-transpeptidase family protein [Allosphingosinicella sp.]|nr:L,D-transpeptidase family protein [Allosphingosinicella sp.]